MSDTREEPLPPPDEAAMPEPPSDPAPRPDRARHGIAVVLAAALLLVIALVVLAPFWTPAVLPLLPWGAAARAQADLTPRLDRLEAAQTEEAQRTAALGDTVQKMAGTAQQLDKRLGALETKPAASPGDVAELRQQIAKLPTVSPGDLADLRQQVGKVSDADSGLANRLGAVEKALQAEKAADQTDTALVLSLLQMRAAIEAGRPFPAEYAAFAALARDRPEIAAAAAPLAEPAKTGIAGRAVLIQRLGQLAGSIADAPPATASQDWQAQAWSRLGSLVTVRRIGGAGQSGPEAAVTEAQRLLAQGDLAGAVNTLGKLSGASAEAARPWLAMARTRLATEDALRQIETQLVTRLGAAGGGARP